MTIVIFFFTACLMFLLGLTLGLLLPVRSKSMAAKHHSVIPDEITNRLREEYNNFLTYDGSEQS